MLLHIESTCHEGVPTSRVQLSLEVVIMARLRSGRTGRTGAGADSGVSFLETSSASRLCHLLRALSVETRPLAELRDNPRNARTHSDKQINQLAASIRTFGFVTPILIDESGMVLAGHGRLAAARQI